VFDPGESVHFPPRAPLSPPNRKLRDLRVGFGIPSELAKTPPATSPCSLPRGWCLLIPIEDDLIPPGPLPGPWLPGSLGLAFSGFADS
jgi:hypothetical protein